MSGRRFRGSQSVAPPPVQEFPVGQATAAYLARPSPPRRVTPPPTPPPPPHPLLRTPIRTLDVPFDAIDIITGEPIANGMMMADFHGERENGRYYGHNSLMDYILQEGLQGRAAINPFNGRRVVSNDVEQYRARVLQPTLRPRGTPPPPIREHEDYHDYDDGNPPPPPSAPAVMVRGGKMVCPICGMKISRKK